MPRTRVATDYLPLPATVVPPVADLGPAMKSLTERQRLFVMAIVMQEGGTPNAARAAVEAGYSAPSQTGAAVAGFRLMHDPKVLAAIQEVARGRITAAVAMAAHDLAEMAADKAVTDQGKRLKLKAMEMLFNRGGLHARTEHRTTVEHTLDEGALIEKVKNLSQTLGLDAKKLLGQAGVTIDADFEVVQPSPVPSAAGLEDLL